MFLVDFEIIQNRATIYNHVSTTQCSKDQNIKFVFVICSGHLNLKHHHRSRKQHTFIRKRTSGETIFMKILIIIYVVLWVLSKYGTQEAILQNVKIHFIIIPNYAFGHFNIFGLIIPLLYNK